MSTPSIAAARLYLTGELDEPALEGTTACTVPSELREQTFTLLVVQHSRLMFRVAFSLLRNAQDAEDAVQEAFLKLYRGDAWRRMEDEKGFLARTVWRVALDRLSTHSGHPLESAAELATNESDSPENAALRGAHAALLRRQIDALPEDLRRVLVLSAIQELNSREIAGMLNVPEGTVRTRLMKARNELKRRFEAVVGRAR